ncbi:MAG: hypothetical protein FJX25_18210 [Alphaproteobacteria bacterium]|nr:hypothetical protein [Alphaproteobacteria bacterium]
MTGAEQAQAFVRVARTGKFSLREIAERAGLSLADAREVLFRGSQLKRLKVNDHDRQNIFITVIDPD